jgi:hypothetical protein
MANRQWDVDLRETQVSAPQLTLWLGWLGYHHHSVTPLKMEPTLVTETSEVKSQTPGQFPKESTLKENQSVICEISVSKGLQNK